MYINFTSLQAIVPYTSKEGLDKLLSTKEMRNCKNNIFVKAFTRNTDEPVWPDFPDKITHASKCIDHPYAHNKVNLLSIKKFAPTSESV